MRKILLYPSVDSFIPEAELYVGMFGCNERRGDKLRRVQEVIPSEPLIGYLRRELEDTPAALEGIERLLIPGARVFLVDTVGAIFVGTQYINGMPDMHVAFWDKVLNGREHMCRNMAKMIAYDARSAGVWTAIPRESRATLAFAQRVGFKDFGGMGPVAALVLLFA